MQKWQKLLLIILCILAVFGGLIGFIITNSGIGDVKVFSNLDVFGLIELILLIISIVCGILDIYETHESKNEFGIPKYNLIIKTKNKLKTIIILFVLTSIIELIIFINLLDIHILPLLFITIILALILVFRNMSSNGLGENGILYCGIYHNWEDVKSLKIQDETLLEMNILINFFGFEYNNIVKFNFDEKDRSDIEIFLKERL